MNASKVDIIDLTGVGLPRQDCQKAAVWMAKAFAQAPATPALTIFFGDASYESNVEMHETFWSSHLNQITMSGMLIGAREDGEWRGFRAFFEPGKSRLPYVTGYKRLAKNEDWDRFLELAGQVEYISRLQEWGEKSSSNNKEFGLTPSEYYTTSVMVVDPAHQRKGIGHLLDEYTRKVVREAKRLLHVRTHENILPFYVAQGYRLIASPIYTLAGSDPFNVHFFS
ncbi:hypothetical protein SCARD494_11376 [Seiridium cardinale]